MNGTIPPVAGEQTTEEQMIQDFVHRVFSDPSLPMALEVQPGEAIRQANVTPRVARVLAKMAPALAYHASQPPGDWKQLRSSNHWWQ